MARLFDDGSSEYLQATNTLGLTGYPFAAAGWFRTDDTTNQGLFGLYASGDLTEVHELRLRDPGDTDLICLTKTGETQEFAASSISYSTGTWQHACGIWVGAGVGDQRVFLDGGNRGTSGNPASWPIGLDRATLGRSINNDPIYLSGRLASVGVWDLSDYPGALNSDKADYFEACIVSGLAAGYSPQFFSLGLVAYWPLGGTKSSDNAANAANGDRDIVGGYHMSPFNTPSVADHPSIIYPSKVRVFPAAVAGVTVRKQQIIGGGIPA